MEEVRAQKRVREQSVFLKCPEPSLIEARLTFMMLLVIWQRHQAKLVTQKLLFGPHCRAVVRINGWGHVNRWEVNGHAGQVVW